MNRPSTATAAYMRFYRLMEIFCRAPFWVTAFLAVLICQGVFWLTRRVRTNLIANLDRVLPERSAFAKWRLANRIVMGYGRHIIDLMRVSQLDADIPTERFIDELRGPENIRAAVDSPVGALLITPHLGHWELGMLVMRQFPNRMAALTAPIRSPYMRRRMEALRARMGVDLVTLEDPSEYLFAIKRLLLESKIVTLLVDRYVGGHSLSVPFFGIEARLPCGYLYLARMVEAPIVPCFIVRNERGKYTCIAEKPIRVARTDDREADVRAALGQVVAVLETYIRRHVDQWYNFEPVWENAPEAAA